MTLKKFENKLRLNRREDYLSDSKPALVRLQKDEYDKILFQLKAV